MNVFVLCTGRCGSVTFSKACEHLTNFTVGHESRSHWLHPWRVAFPDNHIEVDMRLIWSSGLLEERFGGQAFYVHLTREPGLVAKSYWKKLIKNPKGGRSGGGLARGWLNIMRQPIDDELPVFLKDMVATVNINIRAFLRDKPHMVFKLEEAQTSFPKFVQTIGGKGNMAAALKEFETHHNARVPQCA